MLQKIKNIFLALNGIDITIVIFYAFLSALNILFHARINEWLLLILINLGVISFVFAIAYFNSIRENKFWKMIHFFYLPFLILLTFKELYLMIKPMRGIDYDLVLIRIDRWIFGFDPTVALHSFSSPLLTELLQIVYATFYFLPIILVVDFLLRKKYLHAEYTAFSVIFGFFLSYIGYFLVPAIGPRFTLHDFFATNEELPGLLLTNFLREVVNAGESIPSGTLNPAEVVQRDVFPSGHTMMTAITMYLSIKMRSRFWLPLNITGALLIFSTVYLRYHYVIDLIGGLLFCVISLWSGFYFFNWWQKKRDKEIFYYGKI